MFTFCTLVFYFWGQGRVQKLFFFYFTYVVEQLLFPMFSSILTFDFDLFWGSFFTFRALMGYFWGQGRAQTIFEPYTNPKTQKDPKVSKNQKLELKKT